MIASHTYQNGNGFTIILPEGFTRAGRWKVLQARGSWKSRTSVPNKTQTEVLKLFDGKCGQILNDAWNRVSSDEKHLLFYATKLLLETKKGRDGVCCPS